MTWGHCTYGRTVTWNLFLIVNLKSTQIFFHPDYQFSELVWILWPVPKIVDKLNMQFSADPIPLNLKLSLFLGHGHFGLNNISCEWAPRPCVGAPRP